MAARIKENYVDIPPSLSCIPTAKVLWWLGRLNGKLVDDTGAHKKYTLGVIVFIRQYPPPPPPFVYISILEISCRQCRVTNVISQRPTTSLQRASVESPLSLPPYYGLSSQWRSISMCKLKTSEMIKIPSLSQFVVAASGVSTGNDVHSNYRGPSQPASHSVILCVSPILVSIYNCHRS